VNPSRLGRGSVAAICTVAVLVLFIGTLLGYGRREIFRTEAFTERALTVVHDETVSKAIAVMLTDQVVESGTPDLVALRPLIEATTSRLISSGATDPILRVALGSFHRKTFSRDTEALLLDLSDILVLTKGVVGAVRPAAAASLPTAQSVGEIEVVDSETGVWADRAQTVRTLGIALPLIALLLLGGVLLLARDRRRAVVAAGTALMAAGLLLVVALAVARPVVVGAFGDANTDVARVAWDGLLGSLSRWGLILAGIGAIVAASGAAVIPRVDVRAGVVRIWRLLTATPEGRWGPVAQGARAVAAVGIGVLAISDPDTVMQLAFTVGGAISLTWGVSEVLRLGERPADDQTSPELVDIRRRGTRVAATVVGGLAAIGFVGLGAAAMATRGGDPLPAAAPAPCNGSASLCDRPLDRVAMATSHNAMSVAEDPGWFNAHHYNPIVDQLDAGVRGLLIDTYLGQATQRSGFGGTQLVQTDLSQTTRQEVEAKIGKDALAAAERLSGRIVYGQSVENPKLYLCHGLCELGTTDALLQFTQIRQWLDDHPDQVVVIVIENSAPLDAEVAALEASGLVARAWPERLAPDASLPTLRQMIDAGRTAVIMRERSVGTAPVWYQDAYAITQETPYAFPSVAAIRSQASCAPNRGPRTAPLFLLNHWLDKQPVQVSQSAAVNTREVLLGRARLCERARARLPNLVAVNFVEVGDLYRVVDELNGVSEPLIPIPAG
jgi:hypothetical protein